MNELSLKLYIILNPRLFPLDFLLLPSIPAVIGFLANWGTSPELLFHLLLYSCELNIGLLLKFVGILSVIGVYSLM
jgi:hypothetical protein